MACENDKCDAYGLHHDYKDGVEVRKCHLCRHDELRNHLNELNKMGYTEGAKLVTEILKYLMDEIKVIR